MNVYLDSILLLADLRVVMAIAAGTILGLVMGALPGLTAAMAIALLIPLTFGMPPIVGIGMLLGGFCGAVAGGAIPAILLGIPGTPSSVATTLDGFPMARGGRAGRALGIAISSSFVGGMIGAILLFLVAPPIAKFALKFGPAEFFSLGIFGLVIIASVSGGSVLKGLAAGLLGLFLATVGSDPITGVLRFTGGQPALITGIALLPALIGLFAVGQVLQDLTSVRSENKDAGGAKDIANAKPYWGVLWKAKRIVAGSSLIGTIVGAIPGAGGSIASFLAYDQAKRFSKTPEAFGTGHDEGLVASETSNNAMAGGPLFRFSLLGSLAKWQLRCLWVG
nr:tripartite tricarboxylate transporter permease [Falsihalocynthiibacter arcticus]